MPKPKLFEMLEQRRLLSAGAVPYGAGANGIPTDWPASFSDDFNGTTLDSTKWFVRDGVRWDTTHTQDTRPDITSPQSVSVADGNLKLTVFSDATNTYTGWVQTKQRDTDGVIVDDVTDTKFEQSHGYWEARIAFSNGMPGAWQAFWVHSYQMEGAGGAPDVIGTEMDVTESGKWVNANAATDIKSTIHYDGYNNNEATGQTTSLPGGGNVADFHVYGLKWTSTSVTFYIDGTQVGQTFSDPKTISQIRQSIILSNEVSTNYSWTGQIPAAGYGTQASSTTYMKVDYVKVWQDPTSLTARFPQDGTTPIPTPTPTPTGTTSIFGQVFNDANRNGVHDAGEGGLAIQTVYVDLDNDGLLSILEPRAQTDADGYYHLDNIAVGTAKVRIIVPPSYMTTAPTNGSYSLSLNADVPANSVTFGLSSLAPKLGGGIVVSTPIPIPTLPRTTIKSTKTTVGLGILADVLGLILGRRMALASLANTEARRYIARLDFCRKVCAHAQSRLRIQALQGHAQAVQSHRHRQA